ncbi:DNA polymerase I [Algiphilus sp. NNCM1]|uniref:DNA polymerase I n=1 Tax=Algiphilus sp. TaxID=1872431 RepID=UPI001CA6A1C7|nr:DNA polymerase I [Algiphilus sp.]MBY8964371.1 DNA polymerase I [Algiphilus acroporae]MCI5102497.1 DNA polymerase I [Algiphilus sp.]
MAKGPLILIDGSSWLYRAFHALPPLTAPDGSPTGAIYGMANMLRKLFADYDCERIAVIFDPRGGTFRNEMYADYKANRPPVPEDLESQFAPMRELIQALGVPLMQIDGFEADDVIATLARQAEADGAEVLIVSGDKDLAQLVTDRVKLLDTMKGVTFDPAAVRDKYGVPPEQIVDWLALMGDTSDNIPGVQGVGPKTAAKWLDQYGDLDRLLAERDTIKGKAGENLRAAAEQLPLSRKLATVRDDVSLEQRWDRLTRREPDTETLAGLYEQLGFRRWLEALRDTPDEGDDDQTTADTTKAAIKVTTVLDQDALETLRKALEGAELICVDTETDSLDAVRARLVGLSFAVEAGQAWYVPLAHRGLDAPEQLPWDQVRDVLAPLLEDAERPKVGQNLKYDINVLAGAGVTLRGVVHDTMLQSYVLDATARHDMDTLAETHLGHRTIAYSDITGKGKKQIGFDEVAVDKAAEYAGEDADVTLRLHQSLYPRVHDDDKLASVYRDIEMPLVPILAAMEATGVYVDAEVLGGISRELGERMEALQAQCWELAGEQFNLGSAQQLQHILFDKLGLPVSAKTPKGAPSTNEEALDALADQHALPARILEWRGMSKLRSTYADALPKKINPATGRIHTHYHQAATATGRLSSSEPNLQNIPIRTEAGRRIRDAFVAPDDRCLMAIDYSQIELRLMAHFSEDERLIAAFRDDQDIHRATASEVFELSLDEVTSEQRRAAKAINFGLIYGISAYGLARNLGIGRDEAADTIDRFFARYPGVRAYMDGQRERARSQGYVETLFGRRLYLPNIRARNANMRQYAERTAINAPLQGTAADLIKLAMIDVFHWAQSHAPEVHMIMQVHDELVFEGPEQALRDMAAQVTERMCNVTELRVPLVAEPGFGRNWNQAHA